MTETKIKRAGVFLSIHHTTAKDGSPEFRVLRGNKILSRHPTEKEADTALHAHKARPTDETREG